MSYTAVTKPTQGDATKKSLIDLIIDNASDHEARLLAIGTITGLKNGSFESDADSDGIPDSWTRTLYTGGTFLLDTTDQQHSAKSVKFTHPGGASNGGGYIETTDFFEVSPNRPLRLYWEMKSSVAGVNNKVEVTFYTAAQASISTTSLYNSATNPTSWTAKSATFSPPSTARYAKLRLYGADNTNTTAGSTWFDNVLLIQKENPIPSGQVMITSTQSWTVPVGVHRVRVRAWGGGGGGGKGVSARGGGGGAYGEQCLDVTPGDAHTVTIGAGGTGAAAVGAGTNGGNTSFGSLLTANGGAAGDNGVGGGGGTSTATVNMSGTSSISTTGGNAGFGGIGASSISQTGQSPGGGGCGETGGTSGSNGAAGLVIIEY